MRRIAMFGEDHAHREIVGALVRRVARCLGVEMTMAWERARGGHGRVATELKEYALAIRSRQVDEPDLIVVVTDANCAGFKNRVGEIRAAVDLTPLVLAVPDPHIERWLLLDGQAFRSVFGRGCAAPDQKCARGRYKEKLRNAIREANRNAVPVSGGLEYASAIVEQMDLTRAAADPSFRAFLESLRRAFREWLA